MCLATGNAGAPCWEPYRRKPACPGRGVIDHGVVHLLFSSAASPRLLKAGDNPHLSDTAWAAQLKKDQRLMPRRTAWPGRAFLPLCPQWPRMNSTVSRSLRTRHSRVISKIRLRTLRLLRFRPSSLPCFAASDDGHFAPGEPPARPMGLSCCSQPRFLFAVHGSGKLSGTRWKPRRCQIIPVE